VRNGYTKKVADKVGWPVRWCPTLVSCFAKLQNLGGFHPNSLVFVPVSATAANLIILAFFDSDLLVEFARRILISFTIIIMPSGGPRPKQHESVRKAVEDLLRACVRSYQIEGSLRISHS
jgi:hypothetical protein